jgi:hypothetical protein
MISNSLGTVAHQNCCADLEAATHQDPCGRGLAAWREGGGWLDAGSLYLAAASLCSARSVAIVTGFPVITPQGVFAETDGPPGALYLAEALVALGIETTLIGDPICSPLLAAGIEHCGLRQVELLEFPFEPGGADDPPRASNEPPCNAHSDAWAGALLASPAGLRWTHVVAIERPGPSHTVASLVAQPRHGRPPLAEFLAAVPPECRNICQNMRGVSINGHVAKTHRLFELLAEKRKEVVSLGLADGGNELGAGSLAWEVVARAVGGPGARAACRITVSHLLLAGVSNWAAYALAAALLGLRGEAGILSGLGARREGERIQALVRAGAVDGVTARPEPTVDGLPLEAYLAVMQNIVDVAQQGFAARHS